MRPSRDQPSKQCLSYPLRLPNEAQAAALRLLDVSRAVINLTVTALWDRLDAFATRTTTYAYKQVEELIAAPIGQADTPPGLKPHGFSVHRRRQPRDSPKALSAP